MFIEASWKVENATARIHSNTYKLSDNGCQMSLWYHMYGANMGTLNVRTSHHSLAFPSRTAGYFNRSFEKLFFRTHPLSGLPGLSL